MTESEKLRELERRLWAAADQLRANSKLRAADYSVPATVFGALFLSVVVGCAEWTERGHDHRLLGLSPFYEGGLVMPAP